MDTVSAAAAGSIGRYRWRICALLLFATTINYIDRQVLGILAPDLQKAIGWNEQQYSAIVAAFQIAYAIGLVTAGAVIDKLGTRVGYALAICVWSIAAMSHSLAATVVGFAIARFALGLGEAGNFPAAIKTVAEWFPRRERAFATGIFNAGSNVGVIVAAAVVPIIAVTWGWRAAFLFTGLLSATWLVAWLTIYRVPEQHPRLSKGELEYIRSDREEATTKTPWRHLLGHRQTWAFVLAKFMTDPIWWFFLFWLPGYLFRQYDLNLLTFGLPLAAIYLISDVGSIAGGWMSSRLMKAGRSANFARKLTMFVCACAILPVVFAESITSVWLAVLVIGIATAGHQAFSANLYALPSDLFPRGAVGSVVGIGGTVGAIGGFLMAKGTGWVLDADPNNYTVLFAVAACAYFLALIAVHLLSPRFEPVKVAKDA